MDEVQFENQQQLVQAANPFNAAFHDVQGEDAVAQDWDEGMKRLLEDLEGREVQVENRVNGEGVVDQVGGMGWDWGRLDLGLAA